MSNVIQFVLISLLPNLHKAQFFPQPLYYYQQPIAYYQAPMYQQQQYTYPMQFQMQQQPQYYYYQTPQFPTSHLPQYHSANSFANNMLLLREIENVGSKNGNEFRDKEGTFEEPNRLHGLSLGFGEQSKYLSLISDKDNFQTSGCSWDLLQMKCVDGLGLCKGGCRDFAVSPSATLHDCRCIPYGYAALLKLAGK